MKEETPLWRKTANKIVLFLIVLLAWILLSGPAREEMIAGVVCGIIMVILGTRFFNYDLLAMLNPFRLINYVSYLAIFLVQAFIAHAAMFRIILEGEVEPSIIKIKCPVHTEFGRASLSNAITLTPGTMVIDEDKDYIYVHAIKIGKHQPPESVAMPYLKYVTGFAE